MSRAALAGGVVILAVLSAAGASGGDSVTGAHRMARAAGARGNIHQQEVAHFNRPMYLTGPHGAGKLSYVVERQGRVKVLVGGHKHKGTFLDIHHQVACCEVERGMFSIAFPNFRHSRLFYVYYTDNRGDLRIDQFKRKRGSRFKAKASSERHILRIRHRAAANHNGGQLQFGPDGYLYAATGDGGTGGGHAQKRSSLLGKLLRIRPLPHGHKRYRSPHTNPFVGKKGRDEIYARGLRNPWRFSFDRNRIVIGDVGESRREEVDYETRRGARGANFGWNAFEGTLRYRAGHIGHHDKPIHQYAHTNGRCAITGGYVSRKRKLRALYGRYVYADLCTGQVRTLVPHIHGATHDRPLGVAHKPGVVSFGQDAHRRLYLLQQSGEVYRIAR